MVNVLMDVMVVERPELHFAAAACEAVPAAKRTFNSSGDKLGTTRPVDAGGDLECAITFSREPQEPSRLDARQRRRKATSGRTVCQIFQSGGEPQSRRHAGISGIR